MPLITLIVPFYNEAKHLRRCISSIRQQTFSDYEVLLIDDFSTDGSYDLASDLTQGDSRFRLLRNKAKGLYHARNLALTETCSPYLCFLDADDELLPDYLQSLYDDSQRAGDADLVIQGFAHVVNGKHERFSVQATGSYSLPTQAESLFAAFDVVEMGNVFGKLYRRSVISRHLLQFSPHVLMSEDQYFVVSYLTRCQSVYLSSAVNYLYIAHSQSMSTRYWDFLTEERSLLDLKRAWEQLLITFPSKSLRDTYGSFVGNYVNRLVYTLQVHPHHVADRDTYTGRLNREYIPLFAAHCHPTTLFTRSLKWTATHHCYRLYRLLMSLANHRYHITVNFG